MKKLILPTILFAFLLQSIFGQAFAQEESSNKLTCDQVWDIVGTDDCPNWIVNPERGGVWCDLPLSEESATQYWNLYAPKYTFTPGTCGEEEVDQSQEESEQQDAGQPAKQNRSSKDTNFVQVLSDWIRDTFNDVDFEAVEAERLYGRTPQMTEEIINQYKAEQKALYEGPIESPYRLDIQEGDIAIKLPGQTEWATLKQGDRIPSGSTIFTGMDSTTVLSIRDKGVIQVQSFTKITVTEKGLEEAAKTGQTYTDIELRTGEVELNVPGGVFTGSLQVHTPNSTTGVRGTHFWVSYDKEKKLSTTGVYKGQVEVKVSGSDKTILVSPNGDKPGVVVITQKLSVVKLVIVGVVLAAVIGGVVFLKKRGLKVSSPKKKSSR